ncbi:RecB family exonuclease [Actinotalea sp.]|uniref:RecB family exonuclease n=1 Tax=Actinotalea sp. TaxID=1872145 RepID=UPI00356AC2D0
MSSDTPPTTPLGTAPDPVPDRRPRPGLSPSRANDYLQCPLLFRFRVVDRLPEPPSAAATRGTLVHAVLEGLFDLPAGSRTHEAAVAALPAAWQAMVEERPDLVEVLPAGDDLDPWFAPARDLLATYFTLEDPNRLQPAEREMVVRLDLAEDLELRGVVDRLDVAPDGALRVVDYKTGRSPRAGYEGSALFQMRFYALLLARLRGRMPAMLQLIYLGDGVVVRHTPDEAELESTERRVRAIWESVQTSAREDSWNPKRGPLCPWCAHQSICPAFGGTAPPSDPARVEVAIGVRPAEGV